jgi:hypothetical protein
MKLLNKLPGSFREAPGIEWVILKKLPLVLAAGTLLPLIISLANRFIHSAETATHIVKYLKLVDILLIATVVTVWTAVFTVAIGCFIVLIMKGPAYVADAYELVDSERPKP